MKRIVSTSLAHLVVVAVAGCGSHRSALAIGGTLDEGGPVWGTCSYQAAETVASFDPVTRLTKLVGPGLLTSTCSGARVEWDVVKPTGLRLHADETTLSGSPARTVVNATLLAGTRELFDSDCTDYHYKLGPDCAGVATFEKPESHPMFCPISAIIVGTAPGMCTIDATVLGLHATRTLHLQ